MAGFPGGSVVKNLPTNAGDSSSIPDQGTGSHMPQLSVHMLQLRPGTAKEINKNTHF